MRRLPLHRERASQLVQTSEGGTTSGVFSLPQLPLFMDFS
jgi:hypothetical protein